MTFTSDKRPTIEDVAAAAGVSVATVSRALRGLPNVAPSTRDRVHRVATEMAYVAHPTAARLAGGRTGTVAVLVPVFDSWYFAKMVAGIEAALHDAQVDLLLYAVPNESDRERFFAGRGAWWQRSDALIMVDIALDDADASRLKESGATIVTVGSQTSFFSSVALDEPGAAGLAIRHLLGQGHMRIGVLGGDRHSPIFRVPSLRLAGVMVELAVAGIELAPELMIPAGFTIEGGQEGMAQLLDLDVPPTAVFAMSDEMAFGALAELKKRGIAVPDDMCVVGFDDNDVAGVMGLTTVRQDVDSTGAMAARLILQAMEDPETPIERVISPTRLIVRETA